MFNRSEIMKAAWRKFRLARTRYETWQIERGHVDGSFATALRHAWAEAKRTAACVAKEEALVAAQSGPNGGRIAALSREIDLLPYKSLRYDIGTMRQRIEAEISALV